jgi:hypothetical protein
MINMYNYVPINMHIIWNLLVPLLASSPGLPRSVDPRAATQSCDNGASCRELNSESPEAGPVGWCVELLILGIYSLVYYW